MNCPKHMEVSAYLDGMLEQAACQRFTAHLAGCPACRQHLEDLGALRHALRDLPSPILGFDLAANLESRTRGSTARRRPRRSFWADWGVPGLAVALSLASGAWLGALWIGAGSVVAPPAATVRVFDPVPPGGLCAAAELCGPSKGLK